MRNNRLIQFYLTNICNSRCKTCNIWQNKERQDLDFEVVKKVIDTNKDADFVFGGGEFTLYKHKEQLLKYCNDNNISYTVLTNAIRISDVSELVEKYNVKNLTISCDGINHDSIRGKDGNLRNITTLVSLYKDILNLKISYTFSSLNELTFEKDMNFFKSIGINKVYFCLAQNMDLLVSNTDSIVASNIQTIESKIDMLYEKDRNFILALLNNKKHICSSTSSVFTVYTDGSVVRCQSYMSKDILGNIYNDNFNDIIDTSTYKCEYDKQCNLVCQRRYDNYEE